MYEDDDVKTSGKWTCFQAKADSAKCTRTSYNPGSETQVSNCFRS